MSYIRCLSNPEGLYIYLSDNGINIHHSLRPPFSSKDTKGWLEKTIVVPERLFFKACHLWDHGPDAWTGPVKVGDLVVDERHIYEKTGRETGKDWDPIMKARDRKMRARYVIHFQYKAQYIMLWRVTWQYIVAHVVNPSYEKFRCRWCGRIPGRISKKGRIVRKWRALR